MTDSIVSKGFIIAIDGPVASGKDTLAKTLAQRLNGFHLGTGALYRCLTLYCLKNGVNIHDKEEVERILPRVSIDLDDSRVFLNSEDVTESIKWENVSHASPFIAVIHSVRIFMVERQREIGKKQIEKGKIVVAEGRDVGTVIFPNAAFKLFLTASIGVRAQRRFLQIQKKHPGITLVEVEKTVAERDKIDTERKMDPLPKNPAELGYFVFDTSTLSEEETVQVVVQELKKRTLIL